MLDDFDHWVKERLRAKYYIRYMDDFILVHADKAFLEDCLRQIAQRLATLGLELNAKTHIHPLRQGVMFLKWRFILTDSGKVVRRMSKQSIAKFWEVEQNGYRSQHPAAACAAASHCDRNTDDG